MAKLIKSYQNNWCSNLKRSPQAIWAVQPTVQQAHWQLAGTESMKAFRHHTEKVCWKMSFWQLWSSEKRMTSVCTSMPFWCALCIGMRSIPRVCTFCKCPGYSLQACTLSLIKCDEVGGQISFIRLMFQLDFCLDKKDDTTRPYLVTTKLFTQTELHKRSTLISNVISLS